MSWSLAAVLVLGVAIAVGFAWYERSRPSPKVVALVATLAALAALGRIAFAPVPNVKPTTDIVLIAGFVLGGAPGFVVGAVSALASNVFFGQGYWTPWQMVAWGGVGVFGAVLGRVTRGHIGRVPLAAACGLAGLGFGAVMNLSTWVTFAGERSLSSYLVVSGAALPFDLAHMLGNVLFALAFGPALLRALARFRERFAVRWLTAPAPSAPAATTAVGPTTAVVGVVALLACAGALAAPSAARAATPTDYLERAQNADGGWGAIPGGATSQLQTGWAALGLAAAGRNPLDVRRAGRTPIDAIRGGIRSLRDTGELERTILVLVAAGLRPRAFAGRDLVAALLARRRGDGSFDGLVNLTAFGVLALRGAGLPAGSPTVRTAAAFVRRQQNADGGWSFAGRGGASGIDDTSAPVQALVAAGGRAGTGVARGVAFLRARQNADGGFPLTAGGASNAQSTAWVVQALVAAGRDPSAVRRGGSRSPIGYLRSLIASDGSVRYARTSRQTPVWVTAQTLTALARRPFPIAEVVQPASPERGVRDAGTAVPHRAVTPPAAVPAKTSVTPDPPQPRAKRAAPADPRILAIARVAGAATGILMATVMDKSVRLRAP